MTEPVIIVTPEGPLYAGTEANDALTVDALVKGLVGLAGDDTLTGGDGRDVLYGDNLIDFSDPFDLIFDASVIGNDVLYGGASRDFLVAGPGNDTAYGGDGSDYFAVVDDNVAGDVLFGGEGRDILDFSLLPEFGLVLLAVNRLILDSAASIEVLESDVQITGTAGDDHFDLSGVLAYDGSGFPGGGYFLLEAGDDQFLGGRGREVASGGAGDDTLSGGNREDVLYGGDDNDVLRGGGGDDTLAGGLGDDLLNGGGGDDVYWVSDRSDQIVEGASGGVDGVETALRSFTLVDHVENLTFWRTAGAEGIGNAGNNQITGGSGDDTLRGEAGDDVLQGGTLHGEGDDRLYGGGGDDTLAGGAGRDVLTGGDGADHFVFDQWGRSDRPDVVQDFEVGADKIEIGNRAFDGINLPVGPMLAGHFGVVGLDLTGRESILYDPVTGTLATHYGKVFAKVDPGLALTFHDFVWIVDFP